VNAQLYPRLCSAKTSSLAHMASPRYDRLRGQEQYSLDALPHEFAPQSMYRPDTQPAAPNINHSSDTINEDTRSLNMSYTAQYPDSGCSQPASQNFTKAPRNQGKFHLRAWQWEIAASAFSLACFAAVVITLAMYHDQQFLFDISLNTVIAFISTLSRTALLVPVASCISQLKWIYLIRSPHTLREVQVFDNASRGPWGSLELIWKLHYRTKLATWGSIITVLSLTMGPFAQQLLSNQSRLQFSPGATFYSSQVYDSGTSRNTSESWLRGI
jgi:hypothetical protein